MSLLLEPLFLLRPLFPLNLLLVGTIITIIIIGKGVSRTTTTLTIVVIQSLDGLVIVYIGIGTSWTVIITVLT